MDVFEKIKDIIMNELNCKESAITLDAKLKDDLGADSIDAVQIIMDLEETFSIEIDDDNAENIQTVGDLVNYVSELIKK